MGLILHRETSAPNQRRAHRHKKKHQYLAKQHEIFDEPDKSHARCVKKKIDGSLGCWMSVLDLFNRHLKWTRCAIDPGIKVEWAKLSITVKKYNPPHTTTLHMWAICIEYCMNGPFLQTLTLLWYQALSMRLSGRGMFVFFFLIIIVSTFTPRCRT